MTVRRLQAFLAVACVACSDGRTAEASDTEQSSRIAVASALAQAQSAKLEWIGSPVVMQETTDVVVVESVISIDPRGGFLVGDRREAQVRRFAPDGMLLWHFGRSGHGPGEFTGVSAVRRMPSGQIVVADVQGRLTTLDSAGQRLVGDFRAVSDGMIEDLEVLSDTFVIIATRHPPEARQPVLRVLDMQKEEEVRSFFRPYDHATNPYAVHLAGWTKFALRSDTIAAIFAVADSVFFYRTDGTFLNSVPLPSAHFRPVRDDHAPDRSRGRAGMMEWVRAFDLMGEVHWTPAGDVLVAYQGVNPDSGMSRTWHLLTMTRDGRALAEVRNVPTYETMEGELIWLQAPGSVLPNQIARARIRR